MRFFRRTGDREAHSGVRYSRTASVVSFNHDGLEIARSRRSTRWLPMWHIIFFVYLGLLIRLISMAEAGPAAYAHRMAKLENGSFIERTTARIMYMDPVSRAIASKLRARIKSLHPS